MIFLLEFPSLFPISSWYSTIRALTFPSFIYLFIYYQYSSMGFYFSVVFIHTRLIYFGVQLAPSLNSGSHFKLFLILMIYIYHLKKHVLIFWYRKMYQNPLESRTLSASALDSSIFLRSPYSVSRKCSWGWSHCFGGVFCFKFLLD